MRIMREVAAALRQDPDLAPQIQGEMEIAGVQDWAESGIVLRARIRVVASAQWTVRRACLLRLKSAFDAAGIEIPLPQLMLHQGREEVLAADGSPTDAAPAR